MFFTMYSKPSCAEWSLEKLRLCLVPAMATGLFLAIWPASSNASFKRISRPGLTRLQGRKIILKFQFARV